MLTAYRKFNRELLTGKRTHSDIWEDFCRSINASIPLDTLHDAFIHTPIDHEMIRLVMELKDLKYQTGMITDNKADRIDAVVNHHQWHRLFDVIAVSANVGSGKDGEAIFLKALKVLGLEAQECIFIDNNEKNLLVPDAMGMKTVFFDDRRRDMAMLRSALADNGVGA